MVKKERSPNVLPIVSIKSPNELERSIMELFNFMNVMQEIMFTIAVIGVAWLIPDLSNLKERKNA